MRRSSHPPTTWRSWPSGGERKDFTPGGTKAPPSKPKDEETTRPRFAISRSTVSFSNTHKRGGEASWSRPPRREEEFGIPGTGVATIFPASQWPTPLAVGNDAVFKISL